ncbi:MAG: single-stranded DNA-binding protein [Melioribacteraceae bacterium]
MAFSLNKVMLIGNLGADAETRFTTNNVAITTFPLATSRSYKNQNNEWVNETTWHNIVCFNLSDFYKQALKKGKRFYVEGRISKREYSVKDEKRYFTEIVAEQLIPLDAKEQIEPNSENASSKTDVSTEDEANIPPDFDSASSSQDDDLPF